jgi:dienelactone hydrolase
MSTQILNPQQFPDLQPAHGLWQLINPSASPLRYCARSIPEAKAWQSHTRAALRQTIGFQALPPAPLDPQLIEEVDRGDYIRQKVVLRTWQGARMPVYILIPKGVRGRLPVVVAFHGHGYGVKDIVGLRMDGRERKKPAGYQKDFGVALCRRGFLVAAPEISCFGERQTDFAYLQREIGADIPASTCTHTAQMAFHLGGTVVGLRTHDGERLIDYLATRPDVNPLAIGAMGISGGGMHAFFSTCLDERIRACVISGYFCTYQESILAMHHCMCNFIPGLARFGEIYDLAGLIVPRPMLVEAGTRDPIFPIAGVEEAVNKTRPIYRQLGAEDQIETDIFEGNHQISGARAYDFLWEKIVSIDEIRS